MNTTHCDVLIIGAGPAGIAAAHASAAAGARTLLVEKFSAVGGTAVSGLVNAIGGLVADASGTLLNRGLSERLARLLVAGSAADYIFTAQHYSVLLYHPEIFARAARLLLQNSRLTVLTEARLSAVTLNGSTLETVMFSTGSNLYTVHPAVTVDCSGDAVLAPGCGASFLDDDIPLRQAAAFGATLRGVDSAGFRKEKLALLRFMQESPEFSRIVPSVSFLYSLTPGELGIKFSVPDASDETLISSLALARSLHAALHARFKCFADSAIDSLPSRIYSRETNRVRGEYVLTADDVLGCRVFDDAIASNNWPIELWHGCDKPVFEHIPGNGSYTVPYRSLRVHGLGNLLAAGRCLSATHRAHGSARVIGCALATGEAAGYAAARTALDGSSLADFDCERIAYYREKQ